MDPLDLYERATSWTAGKIPGALDRLDAPTPCEAWDVRTLLNHLLHAQQIFAAAASGEGASPPADMPPDLLGEDPVRQYEDGRQTVLEAFRRPGAMEKGGRTLAIGFVDQLVHGWDLAKASGQDATMPQDLAEAAFKGVDGRLPEEGRGVFFKPSLEPPAGAGAQEKLLSYLGRNS